MTERISEDWLEQLEQTNYEPGEDSANVYQSYRFEKVDIDAVKKD